MYTLVGYDEIIGNLSSRGSLGCSQAKLTVSVLSENDRGEVVSQIREFGGFKCDRREMVAWVASFQPELVVIPKGRKWKAPAFIVRARMAVLEWHDLKLAMVNACHVKQVPGRKTDINDA